MMIPIFYNIRQTVNAVRAEPVEANAALRQAQGERFGISSINVTRRHIMLASTGLAASVLMRPALASSDELAAAVAAYAGGQKITPEKVKLDVAELVDNGNVVPITVSVDSPMTSSNHVKTIAIFNEKNPQREVAKFILGPRYGKASVSTRIRLATTQKLVAVAQMSDGTYWSHTVDVIVTLAACIET